MKYEVLISAAFSPFQYGSKHFEISKKLIDYAQIQKQLPGGNL